MFIGVISSQNIQGNLNRAILTNVCHNVVNFKRKKYHCD